MRNAGKGLASSHKKPFGPRALRPSLHGMGTRWQVPAYSPQLKNTSTFTEMTSNSRPHFHFVLYMLYATVLDSESNQRLRNFTECGLSNGHLKRKDAVSVNTESSPSCCRVSKHQRQQRRQQLPSPTGRTGSASPAGQCWPTPKRATGPLEKRSSLEETRTPWPPAAPPLCRCRLRSGL